MASAVTSTRNTTTHEIKRFLSRERIVQGKTNYQPIAFINKAMIVL